MKAFTLTLSHPYKGMRERTERQAEGKTTLLGVGWFFPYCHWTAPVPYKTKNPENLMVLRGQQVTSSSAASAAIVTAIIAAPTALVAAMIITTLVAVVVVPFVT